MTRRRDIWGVPNPFPGGPTESGLGSALTILPFSRRLGLTVVLGIALLLPACSSIEFPAVHDMPTARPAAERLSADEQKKAEAELLAARDIQRTGTAPPPPAATAAKPPAAAAPATKKPTVAPTREAAAGNEQKP